MGFGAISYTDFRIGFRALILQRNSLQNFLLQRIQLCVYDGLIFCTIGFYHVQHIHCRPIERFIGILVGRIHGCFCAAILIRIVRNKGRYQRGAQRHVLYSREFIRGILRNLEYVRFHDVAVANRIVSLFPRVVCR